MREKKREDRVLQTQRKKGRKKEIGFGKPYDEGSQVEATLAILALSNEQQLDEGEEED